MILSRIIVFIILFILFSFIIGSINFDYNKKKYTMVTLAMVYNFSWGFMSVISFELVYLLFINRPNGSGYYVPESEHGSNISMGIAMLLFYLLLLLPINIYFKKKSELSLKEYSWTSIAAAIGGLLFFIAIVGQM